MEDLTGVLAPGPDMCPSTSLGYGERKRYRVATPATNVLAGKAGGSLVGGFHHLDELIVLWPDPSERSPKCLLREDFTS